MRRASAARMVFAVVLLSVAFVCTPANAARGGAKCRTAGAIEMTKEITYECKHSGGKLRWVRTRTVARVSEDQVDVVIGFQVKAIYVVPADGVDHSYDTNGYIAGILDEGTKYLQRQLGLRIPIDRSANGYDIQYLKSKITTANFDAIGDQDDELLAETLALENPSPNRKNFIFFVDVKDVYNGTACGFAPVPGMTAVVAIGKGVDAKGYECTGESHNFNDWVAWTWVHELIHNFGVSHTLDDPCDLMTDADTCPSDQKITIDKERTRYIGSSTQGQDILRLRVWEGQTDNLDLEAYCRLNPVPRTDGFQYAYCPTGTQTIGTMKICYSQIYSVTLEEFVDGQWTSLGSGSHFLDHWGPNVVWRCRQGFTGASKQLTVTTPGISLYRWMVNGKESEQFKVIWVR